MRFLFYATGHVYIHSVYNYIFPHVYHTQIKTKMGQYKYESHYWRLTLNKDTSLYAAKLTVLLFRSVIIILMAFIERNVSSDGKRVMTLQQFKQWVKTSFDTNNDGRISKTELREALRLTGVLFASWKTNKVMKFVDANHDGFIDDKEFINLAQFAEKHLNIRITK